MLTTAAAGALPEGLTTTGWQTIRQQIATHAYSATGQLPVTLVGLRQQALALLEGDDGIDVRIEAVDMVEESHH